MNADFASVMVSPPRVRCIGVGLQPFTFGHWLLLRATGSRFSTGEFPLYEDLIAGAFICAHTWEENQALLRSPLRRWLRLKVWGWLAGRFDVVKELVTLAAHVRDGAELPEQAKARGGGVRYLISEWDTRLFAHLLSLGYSESAALNMPLMKANKLFVAYLEESGLGEFKSKRALDREDEMTRLVEEMEREAALPTPETHAMETRIA